MAEVLASPRRLRALHDSVGSLLAKYSDPLLRESFSEEDFGTLRLYLFAVVVYRAEGDARLTVAAEARALKAAEEERLRGRSGVELMDAFAAVDLRAAKRVTEAGAAAAAEEERVVASAADPAETLVQRTGAAWLWLDSAGRAG